jgi:PAS domain S-box-containing protein
MLGMTTEQILGDEPLSEGTYPIDADGARLQRSHFPSRQVIATGEPLIGLVIGVRRPGRWDQWLQINAVPIPGPHGEEHGGCFLTIREHTSQRLLEAQLRRHAEIFRRTSDGIVIIDRDARINEWSDGARRLFGYDAEEVIGCYAWMLHDHDALGERLREMRSFLRERKDWMGEMTFRRKDGGTGIAEVELFPVVTADNRLVEVQIIYHNVTVQRRATEEARLRARYLEALADLATMLLEVEERLPCVAPSRFSARPPERAAAMSSRTATARRGSGTPRNSPNGARPASRPKLTTPSCSTCPTSRSLKCCATISSAGSRTRPSSATNRRAFGKSSKYRESRPSCCCRFSPTMAALAL